ncbi:sarcoplasmic reticulum histidine-rich calcium-binding protein-like [Arabidopsis lyrata subsp. lyrata]|uniref:sarcoplasmic reticulum histidine-rich calcium-binding protein-like n=1 Tax=Arabidopsis lyrata subsp. lyrata TaxID=81972 RepID=UPI000A29A544|nr:sarcoplasmic reticulum histidine-rich calcium-binding protein-like [Arabidopsis lyrata subsp. lyrata]|eukprot:XP_020877498.1 sarcoplasmic reticulum histidine-rich calcium-binding protein-like [Arabidopsis lyrata subsp. lyrata]
MGNRKNKRVTKKTRDLEEVLEENIAQGHAADIETEEAGHDLLNGAGNDVVNEAGNDVGTGAAGSLNEEDELEENSEEQAADEENEELGNDVVNGDDEQTQNVPEEQAADEENEELGNDVVNGDDEQTQNVPEEQAADDDIVAEPKRKKQRGPTKMKHIAKDPNEKQHVDFTDMGEHCGPGSVLLSSYLGPLVREHVPVIIDTWKKVGEDIKTVLWKSIEARFDIDEDYKKTAVFKQMGCLWRASKSRLVSKVRKARTMKDRMSLRPNNVPPTAWRLFVKAKTSNAFKVFT